MRSFSISGIQQAQDANLHNIAVVKPSGTLGRAIHQLTIALHRRAVAFTHVLTGTLRASHLINFDAWGPTGTIYPSSRARNPRSRQYASDYALHEHNRGGEHAFYQRAIDSAPGDMDRAESMISGDII